MNTLKKEFSSRAELIEYVSGLSAFTKEKNYSQIIGGKEAAVAKLRMIHPINYGRTRNYLDGEVTGLSPYISHGILSLNQVRNVALKKCSEPLQITKFIQQLAWRDYWQRIYQNHPEYIWQDIENYKTGFALSDYDDELPSDILGAKTQIASIDYFINELTKTGYLHNHARLYLASYVVHWRRIKWQAGAKWFLHHLLDGDPASNNLSWQWVASTFSHKPYIFNLDNVKKYAKPGIDLSHDANKELDYSYEELSKKLFPKLGEI